MTQDRKPLDEGSPATRRFIPGTLQKRDVFSETISGSLEGQPDFPVVLRSLKNVPFYARPLAIWLARRERRALDAVAGIEGCPSLIHADRDGLLREWTIGTPLQLAQPRDALFYADARRLLREMRRAGVTHNDIAKPQNWLMTPTGHAAVIDFQLASVHRRQNSLFRIMAREDLRHLLKQKRAYAPELLTPSQTRMLAQKSLLAQIWMATGKRAYNFVTRRLMNWSDGEGTEDRLERDGPSLRAALQSNSEIKDLVICTFARPAKGAGLYLFVETGLPEDALRALCPTPKPELIQRVDALPRDAKGMPRLDALQLVASNRLDELAQLQGNSPELTPTLAPIIAGRLNFTDRDRPQHRA